MLDGSLSLRTARPFPAADVTSIQTGFFGCCQKPEIPSALQRLEEAAGITIQVMLLDEGVITERQT